MIFCWIILLAAIRGSWTFHVELRAPRYVSLGSSAILKCDYSVSHEMVHKVEWLRHGKKIFQYVKGRRPPFRNYTIPGAHMDVSCVH
ncbi:hypothetical protein LSTR_LSTR016887 [Laodelphax striatellus]|uniref:Ig-like domain-containing protein n=1 Tax=Laodelphax striatellus TaxID=195883 RepID=A0A482X3B0_LAOST|nr:hypothetical protein LSTR_LSTR016887 [Laodelphax striatellus]